MSKIMSVFEKLNLVEKVDEKVVGIKTIENNDIEEKVDPKVVNTEFLDTKTIEYNNEKKQNEKKQIEPKIIENNTIDNRSEVKLLQEYTKESEVSLEDKCLYENNMDITEIYTKSGIENCDVNTIFMLGNFINALPENLPSEIKKQSITNIIQASNIDLNKLILDGNERLKALSEFEKKFKNTTSNTIENYKNEIIKLNNLITNYKNEIQKKEIMLEEQNNLIKYEIEKINNIINFFSNDI